MSKTLKSKLEEIAQLESELLQSREAMLKLIPKGQQPVYTPPVPLKLVKILKEGAE